MEKSIKTVQFLNFDIEIFFFKGKVSPFPNHFHKYYVIGFIKNGCRNLICNNKKYTLKKGCILLLNPNDTHSCNSFNEDIFEYFGININEELMKKITGHIFNKEFLPRFLKNVVYEENLFQNLNFEKEENILPMIFYLIKKYSKPYNDFKNCASKIETVCEFMQKNYNEKITLDNVSKISNLSKATLLRHFVKSKGITPYKYLESIRVDFAKTYLLNGYSPLETAFAAGFFDQSHFTNCFNSYFGFTPAQYQKILQPLKKGKV